MASTRRRYSEKDISVVIPTYNRSEELKITLHALKRFLPKIREVVVVDQSAGRDTKKVVSSFRSKKILYIYSKIPSITIARNLGVKNSSRETKIICFIDDDVTLKPDYFKGILNVFNSFSHAMGAAAYVPQEESIDKEGLFEIIARRVFFLGGRLKVDDASIVSSYGNRYPKLISSTINAQWFPGDNMVYKKEIFSRIKSDENLLGYTVAEDIDLSYRVHKNFPNSLFITPHAHLIHRYSSKARHPTANLAFLNQVDHFYFNFKNLNETFSDKMKFFWSLFGISLLRIFNFIRTGRKEDALKITFFFASFWYCITHLASIRKGKVREFETSRIL